MLKDKISPIVYLAAATLLFRGLYVLTRTRVKGGWKTRYDLFKMGIGLVLGTDLALPFGNRKTLIK